MLPCIDDSYIKEHQAEWDVAEDDFENSYVSLEEVIKNYREASPSSLEHDNTA